MEWDGLLMAGKFIYLDQPERYIWKYSPQHLLMDAPLPSPSVVAVAAIPAPHLPASVTLVFSDNGYKQQRLELSLLVLGPRQNYRDAV